MAISDISSFPGREVVIDNDAFISLLFNGYRNIEYKFFFLAGYYGKAIMGIFILYGFSGVQTILDELIMKIYAVLDDG